MGDLKITLLLGLAQVNMDRLDKSLSLSISVAGVTVLASYSSESNSAI